MTDKNNEADENLEATEENVDPRLDNRVGDQRPPLETFPAKPQQVDGPDLAHTPDAKEAARLAKENQEEDDVTRKGMHSPGPHGLGDTNAEQPEKEDNK